MFLEYTDPDFYVGDDVVAFSASSDVLACGWLNIAVGTPAMQPRLTAHHLPSKGLRLNYT